MLNKQKRNPTQRCQFRRRSFIPFTAKSRGTPDRKRATRGQSRNFSREASAFNNPTLYLMTTAPV
jgi:hypothetical protein